ncbi:MAG: relaxase/mobilization nuclease domain-containing protein [Solirubrobacteraceae bacterium]
MIPNVTRGGKTHGVLLYLVGKGKREEHETPHLVAGSPEATRMATLSKLLERSDAVALARFLDEPREAFGTRVTIAERDKDGRLIGARDAHVWHCSLSLHPQEPELADERWAEICEQLIEQMGFAGETARAQCRWVAIRHGRSAGGSDHAHLVVTLVAEDGSKASVHNDRPRAQKACRELEQRFGLRGLEARTREAGSRGLKHGELSADRRRGRQLGERGEHPERSSRQTLERIVRACATASRDESEFIRRLGDEGIRYRARYAEGGTDVVVGYSVRLPGAADGPRRSVWYGGGRLARDLTLPALRRSWGQNGDARRRAVAEWKTSTTSRRSPAERQAELEQRALIWHRCTTELERVRQQLRAAGTDPAAIAHAAREGAGVLAAWSLALEGEQPGALARAARHLARSAELPAYTRAAAKSPSRAPGLALFMLAAGKPDSAVGWAIVAREISLLATELGRVHRARGELDRAQQIETELGAELARIEAALERDQPQAGEDLDAEAQAAKRPRDPLPPPTRDPGRASSDDGENVKRVLGPLQRRRGRGR